MPLPLRPASLTFFAGSAWLLAATLAQAGPATAPQPAAETGQVPPDAAPQLPPPAVPPHEDRAEAGAGAAAGPADAQIPAIAPSAPGQWSFSVSPYLWMASVKTSFKFTPDIAPDRTISADVHQSFGDVFNQLNFAIMGGAEARRGLFSLNLDAMYINLLQDHSGVRSVTGPRGDLEIPISIGGKLKLKETMFTLGGGYDIFRNDRGFFQLFGGVRYLRLNSTLDWNFAGPLGDLAREGSVGSVTNIWNGIAGMRGEHALGDGPWKAIYYVDVGGGGSRLTWQALAAVAWVRRWGDVDLGYRTLQFSQGTENSTADVRMSGPVITVRFRFGG